jgi:hypothetical protein
MEIKQEKSFSPITITLTNKEEAEALWNAIDKRPIVTTYASEFLRRLSNWFSNEAQL